MNFNLNDNVRVKLTDFGRRCLRERHDELEQFITARGGKMPAYSPPKEDAEGWSEWQLWSLMAGLGPHIRLGGFPPFETTIDIPTAGQNPRK